MNSAANIVKKKILGFLHGTLLHGRSRVRKMMKILGCITWRYNFMWFFSRVLRERVQKKNGNYPENVRPKSWSLYPK